MNKFILVENTGLLRIKIQKNLESYGFTNVDYLDFKLLNMTNKKYIFNGCEILFIDYDMFTSEVVKLIKEVRLIESCRNMQIVVMTKSTDPMTIKDLLLIGVNDIIAKPFSDVKFMEKVFKNRPEPTIHDKEFQQHEDKKQEVVMPEWHDDFSIGDEAIDGEHKGIITQYEKLYDLMKTGKGHEFFTEFLAFLDEYITVHFDHEEAFQKKIGYDDMVRHKQLHEGFKDELRKIAAAHGEQVSNMELLKFNMFIRSWLIHHILVEDKKIGAFVANAQ